MLPAVLLASASAIVFGIADFLGGLASRKIPPVGVVAVTQPVGLAVVTVLVLLTPGHLHIEDLAWGAASGIGFVIGIVLFYIGLERSRMALVSPISAVIGASLPVIFGYALGERPSTLASIGVGLAFLAVGLVSSNGDQFSKGFAQSGSQCRDPGIVPALLSGLGFGVSMLCISRGRHNAGLWPLLAAQVTSTVCILLWVRTRPVAVKPDPKTLHSIVLVGILTATASVFYVLATHRGVLPIVSVVASLYPVSTVLLACTLLHERLSPSQWVGIACAACGVTFIARGSA